MCNIDCVPKTWSLSLKDYALLDDFCKNNSLSEDDFCWMMDFCERKSLDFKNFCSLVKFYDFHKNKCYSNLEKKKNELEDSLNLKFVDKKFIISSRVKSFLRVIKKIDKKKNSELDGLSWNDITTSYVNFEKTINKYVRDFCGCRVIPVPRSFDFSILNLNSTLKTLSPQDFLFKLFIPTTINYENFDDNILYSIKDFFDDEFKILNYKNFLKFPKSNGYRSLQFGCVFDDDERMEIQIRNFLHHIYAEYEHRRYEEKLNFSEFIPFYLSCEICSNYFASDEIKKFDFSRIAFMYFICLSILTNDVMHFSELDVQIDNYVSEYYYTVYDYIYYNCEGNNIYNFECNDLYNSDDEFVQICISIIKSVKDSIIMDSQRFGTTIKNQTKLEMDLLRDDYIKSRIMSILNAKKQNHSLCYKINNK